MSDDETIAAVDGGRPSGRSSPVVGHHCSVVGGERRAWRVVCECGYLSTKAGTQRAAVETAVHHVRMVQSERARNGMRGSGWRRPLQPATAGGRKGKLVGPGQPH